MLRSLAGRGLSHVKEEIPDAVASALGAAAAGGGMYLMQRPGADGKSWNQRLHERKSPEADAGIEKAKAEGRPVEFKDSYNKAMTEGGKSLTDLFANNPRKAAMVAALIGAPLGMMMRRSGSAVLDKIKNFKK